CMSVVNSSRPALRSKSSSIPGSWIVVSPRRSVATFPSSMSIATTSWPRSAKQVAVTRPTQPTPITPMASRFSVMSLSVQLSRARGDREHLLLGERVGERIDHPVRAALGLPADQSQTVAIVEEQVLATVDPPPLARVAEDRRVDPVDAADAVVGGEPGLLVRHHELVAAED